MSTLESFALKARRRQRIERKKERRAAAIRKERQRDELRGYGYELDEYRAVRERESMFRTGQENSAGRKRQGKNRGFAGTVTEGRIAYERGQAELYGRTAYGRDELKRMLNY